MLALLGRQSCLVLRDEAGRAVHVEDYLSPLRRWRHFALHRQIGEQRERVPVLLQRDSFDLNRPTECEVAFRRVGGMSLYISADSLGDKEATLGLLKPV